MSTAIIKFKDNPECLVYCKNHSYPAGLGFELLDMNMSDGKYSSQQIHSSLIEFFKCHSDRFEFVFKIPKDIQYEYIIEDNNVHCQECWYTPDAAYHGGGIRHGGVYDLVEWREKIRLQTAYTYRRDEDWK